MCLGVPMKILSVKDQTAICERDGVLREVALQLIDDELNVGDYLLIHLGFAIEVIPQKDAEEAEKTWRAWSALNKQKTSGNA